mgnify:CR=1 FL=1|tara:strand:- start:642 stop:1781 length:1140 start_codon:yes stop_codon:yes gene_type:complete
MAQVANKDIANSSGAGVRADLNLALAAEASNNFGPKADAGQVLPCELVADNSTSPKKLLIRSTTGDDGTSGTTPTYFDVGNLDEANLGLVKRVGDTLTGPLELDDGSGASSPALSFDGDSDTGIFRQSANTMGFSTAGTQRVGISNAGLDMLNALPIRFQDTSGSPFVSLQSPSSLSGNVALTLPSSITNGGFLQTDGSGNLSFSIVEGVPTGSVFAFVGSTAPTGYLKANGDTIPNGSGTVQGVTANFAALYALVGATLPDLRGEFVRGFDDSRGVDSGRSINSSQGGENATHNHAASSSVSESSHTHNMRGLALSGGSGSVGITLGSGQSYQIGYSGSISSRSSGSASTGISVSTTTSNQGSEARPRNVAMLYIIKI